MAITVFVLVVILVHRFLLVTRDEVRYPCRRGGWLDLLNNSPNPASNMTEKTITPRTRLTLLTLLDLLDKDPRRRMRGSRHCPAGGTGASDRIVDPFLFLSEFDLYPVIFTQGHPPSLPESRLERTLFYCSKQERKKKPSWLLLDLLPL